ncbi:hypothetical protein LZ30DRAFT_690835 [Colletotrichum cereale]|nr:hypothetical protein LZ30DRAFT_690835 [Colletotrichum cereale]
MISCIRVADVLLFLLITQTAQAGPRRHYIRGPSLGDGTRGTGWSHPDPNLCDPRRHDYRCPSRITVSNHTRRSNPFNDTNSVNPEITVDTDNSVGATFATSRVQYYLLAVNGSSLYPGSTASASTPLSPPEGASSVATQTAPLQSSVSFAFPVPGETNAATTTAAEQSGASSALAPILSSTDNVEGSSPPASSTTIVAASTTASTVQATPEIPSPASSTPSSTVPLSTLSSTLRVTGTPNNQVPTIRTSTPAASATVSPEVAANNLASAKTFNTLFASLTEQSACAAGQIACVKGNVGICGSDGAFAIQNCGTGTSCFALPMSTTEGVIVGCYDPKVASGILGTPVSAPVPGSSTSAPQAPPASGVASDITTTITPTIIATFTVSINPPAASPQTSSAAQAPGFTTTVVVTKTIEPVPAPPSTTAEEDGPPTTSTSGRRTRTSTAEEETTTVRSTTAESSPVSTTAETTRKATQSKSTPASTASSSTGTFTDTLIVNPIPTDEPSEPPTKLIVGPTPSASPPPGINVPQGTPTLTVFVTVTQKERETVTVTVTKG